MVESLVNLNYDNEFVMIPLPLEIVLYISKRLDKNKYTQCNLALLNSNTYQVLTPYLYQNVKLWRPKAILSFCTTISKNSKLGPIVKYLHVYSSSDSDNLPLPEIAASLHPTFTLLVNLYELHLLYPLNPLRNATEYPHIKSGSKLRRLITCAYPRSHLHNFLLSHGNLTYLEITNEAVSACDLEQSFTDFSDDPDLLPELSELVGPSCRVIDLLLHRPIQKVDVELDTTTLDIVSLACLKFGLAELIGPVTELRVQQGPLKPYAFWNIIMVDTSSPLSLNLRRLALCINGSKIREDIWKYHARGLKDYQVLEELTFESAAGYEHELETLSELRQLKYWKSHCSSLRVVKAFGVLLS